MEGLILIPTLVTEDELLKTKNSHSNSGGARQHVSDASLNERGFEHFINSVIFLF